MTANSFLILALQMHFFLVVSYLSFAILTARIQMPAQLRLRLGRAAFILGLTLPLFVGVLPEESLPQVTSISAPVAEWTQQRFAPPDDLYRKRISSGARAASLATIRSRAVGDWICVAWALLLGAAAIHFGAQWFRLFRLLRRSHLVHGYGSVRIAVSEEVGIPFSTSIDGKKWVVVPQSLASAPSHFLMAVRHELQHHRACDTRWSIAVEIAGLFFFGNPFSAAWKRAFVEWQEFACDEALLDRRKVKSHEYGTCLLRVAEAAIGSKSLGVSCLATGSSHPAKFKTLLQRRIEMLFERKRSQTSRVWLAVAGFCLLNGSVVLAVHSIQREKPNAGVAIVDPTIQKMAEGLLKKAVERHKARGGFVLVGDPQTGRLLAVANQDKSKNHAKSAHWALSKRLEPASAMKAFVAAAAVDQGLTTLEEKHACENGKYKVGSQTFQDWTSFASLSTAETVAQSSNICGIKIAQKLGAEKLAKALTDFGFGAGGTTQGFPEAMAGATAPHNDSQFYVATVGTGYDGIQVTPLEILQAMGAIANGGELLKPISGYSQREVIRRVLSTEGAASARQMLRGVVTNGTGQKIANSKYALAGKTSSAHDPNDKFHEKLGGSASVAGFAGFAPAENPKLVAYAVIFEPRDGDGHANGSQHAAPLFREIAESVLEYQGVKPSTN